MTRFEITYIRTGSGEKKTTDRVVVYSSDERKDGSKVNDIMGAIQYFEELAEGWGSYENKNAIVKIEAKELSELGSGNTMKEARFKAGDKVRVVRETPSHSVSIGMTGTVICFFRDLIGVKFDKEFFGGHSLYGNCETGYGQWMKNHDLELVHDN